MPRAGRSLRVTSVRPHTAPSRRLALVLLLTLVGLLSLGARPALAFECPCSLWPGSATPASPAAPDSSAVEIGVKFSAATSGRITALRFYKGAGNTGTHVGHLWTAGGTLLAQATFSGESASGWQQVSLPQPVSITAGSTYVASYHAPNGHYAYNAPYFGSAHDSGPLHAPADGEQGGNGVYAYSSSPNFPSTSWNAANYWVDVVFEPGGLDTTPPLVASASPRDGATAVPRTTNVRVSFTEPMAASSINASSIRLTGPNGATVPAAVGYDPATRVATLDPGSDLAYAGSYSLTVKGGSSGVKDVAGNSLASDFSSAFTTVDPPPPPPDQGPGGPLLVITSAADRFSAYYAEILRAEGFNEFAVRDISAVTPATLGAYDTAILGSMPLSSASVGVLTNWVNAGGNLIAMRPDKQLAALLGLTNASATLSNGYLKVDTAKPPGTGIVGETIQFHGTADRYATSGAKTVATLYLDAANTTPSPAVSVRDVGSNGGQAAAFSYDLARSVVYTRQGNPAWAGQDRDGTPPIRTHDLFFGGSQPNWIDLGKVGIPQADEQQRLLANLIESVNADRKPLPRFWYLPRGFEAAVVMTGDDHANGGTSGRFDGHRAASPPGCSVEQWECVRSTSYIYPNTALTAAQALQYEDDGFEVALHLSTGCGNYTPSSLDSFLDDQLAEFKAKYASLSSPATNRTHCVVWSDWAGMPKAELEHGIRLDTNYYHYPASWIGGAVGMFTGSGLPMRFADADGGMVDVYQAATQMTDESGQSYPATANALLDRALGAEGYYGAFTANMHTDSSTHSGSDAIVAAAKARNVPVVSAKQMLTWLDARNASSFGSLAWSADKLSFTVNPASAATGLRAMLPTRAGAKSLQAIDRGGAPVDFTRETVKGIEYAFFPAVGGSYTAQYAGGNRQPTASFTVSPNPAATRGSVSFDAGASSDPDGPIANYAWDLDGNGSFEIDTGTTASTTRVYDTVGSVSVGLRVTDADGAAATTTRSLSVTSAYRVGILGTPGIKGYWRLDGSGGSAADLVRGNTGTFNGPLPAGPLIAGEQNGARTFDGVDDYVDLAPIGGLSRVSAEAWVRTETTKPTGAHHALVAQTANAFDDGFTLAVNNQNRAIFAAAGRTGVGGLVIARASAVSSVALSPNTTHHVLGTYDGGAVRIYVDGALAGTTTFGAGIFYASGYDLWFGRSRGSLLGALDGALDEVAVYNTALAPTTVKAHYDLGKP